MSDRVCQSEDKLLDKRGFYIFSNKSITVLFSGELISKQNFTAFKAKAEEFTNYLLKYEKASPNIKFISESTLNKQNKNFSKENLSIMQNLFNFAVDNKFTATYQNYDFWYELKTAYSPLSSVINQQENNYYNLGNSSINNQSKSDSLKLTPLSFNLPLKKESNNTSVSKINANQKQEKTTNNQQKSELDEQEEEKVRKRVLVYPEKEKNTFLDVDDFDQNELIVILVEKSKTKFAYVWRSSESIDSTTLNKYLLEIQEKFFGQGNLDGIKIIYETPYEESEEFFALF